MSPGAAGWKRQSRDTIPACSVPPPLNSPPHFLPTCTRVSLTQAATVARNRHEGPQGAADDTVRSAEGGLLERAGVLVQEGVHAVGCGGASVSHEGL